VLRMFQKVYRPLFCGMNTQMNYRHVTQADVQELAKGYVSSFLEVDPSEQWTVPRAEELIRFFLNTQEDLAFLVEDGIQIVGGIFGVVKPWWDGNHLVETELFVLPGYQKKGVGKRLFSHLLEYASQHYDVTKMESITFKDLEFPGSWYRKLGFEEKEDWKVILGEVETIKNSLK